MGSELTVIKKVHFINALEEAATIVDVFYCEAQTEAKKRNGGSFWNLDLRDCTGTIQAKMWDKLVNDHMAGKYIKVEADVGSYKGAQQLTLRKVRLLDPHTETIDPADFMRVSKNDRHVVLAELEKLLEDNIKSPRIKRILHDLLSDTLLREAVLMAPAAKGNHHPFAGGLLDHTLSLAKLAVAVCPNYPSVDLDVVLAGCVIHDVGKTSELCFEHGAIRMTKRGKLIGHVSDSANLLHIVTQPQWEGWKDFREHHETLHREILEIEHVVVSHHGRVEWGAVRRPMTREAILFHHLDMIDSHQGLLDEVDQMPVDAEGFTQYVRALECETWWPKKAKETV